MVFNYLNLSRRLLKLIAKWGLHFGEMQSRRKRKMYFLHSNSLMMTRFPLATRTLHVMYMIFDMKMIGLVRKA